MITEHTSVVVVERQPMMRTALSTTLASEGMTVLAEVADSRQALKTALEKTPDLLLFSVSHPSLGDLERISMLRQVIPDILIVALVTGEFRGQCQSALDHGADLVLTKSAPRSELLNAIRSVAQSRIYPAIMQVD